MTQVILVIVLILINLTGQDFLYLDVVVVIAMTARINYEHNFISSFEAGEQSEQGEPGPVGPARSRTCRGAIPGPPARLHQCPPAASANRPSAEPTEIGLDRADIDHPARNGIAADNTECH